MQLYKNKVVLITGAASGIGKTVALTYAQQGANLVIWDRDDEGLADTQKQIQQTGSTALSLKIDLTNPDEIVTGIKTAAEKFGRVDILINNAGLGKSASVYDLSVDDWDYVINTNLRGTFLCSREAARIMKMNNGGFIINIASTRALMSEPDTEAYAASKGGILALTHALAISLGPDHIMVNAISPGWIQTGDYSNLSRTDHQQHPAGRVGKTDDIARACLYLTNPENDFITGTNLVIDGGMTRKMIYAE
ncbi:SDR family NAD(P)-dependent oxidoreductase [Dyadobacter psychrotolerans]|uniref:SDR family oxidoreductase n=1 Tax=Dyadobacter psychrotolerans TaxID=2541721 RepID=A0A4R5DVW1_9BACT|nr:glucose 1-dehydrogenase [Dyadobacter psychrotolerans]TDE15385.1 SDR family oxidoreductase [Dyadobacter psychrotolerans]